jgi:hypothetical protein
MNAKSRDDAELSRQTFADSFDDKYPKAVKSLNEGWEELTTFFDFPAQHWLHIRTTNPIELAFATVKLRTKATKGSGSPQMAEAMALKLLREAQKRWNKIRGLEHLRIMLRPVFTQRRCTGRGSPNKVSRSGMIDNFLHYLKLPYGMNGFFRTGSLKRCYISC